MMPSGPEALIVFLSVLRAGGVAVMCNAGQTSQELLHSAVTAVPHAVISNSSEVLQRAQDCLPEMPESNFLNIDVHSCTSSHSHELPEVGARSGGDTALIVFSSGTSGLQKAVELTHEGLIALFPLQISASFYSFDKQETAFLAMPMYHIGGLCSFLLNTLKGQSFLLTFLSISVLTPALQAITAY
jgi:long-chain acyl-CoA synthetase